MGTSTFKVEEGIIEYRIPNIKETISITKLIKSISSQDKSEDEKNLEAAEELIEVLRPHIIKVDICDAKDYDDFVGTIENFIVYTKFIQKFLSHLNMDAKKKNKSEK